MQNPSEVDTAIFNRDKILSQINNLLYIQDKSLKAIDTTEFLHKRLKLLVGSATPREFSIFSKPRKGFLHPDGVIRRSFTSEPFYVDDPEIYTLLINTIAEFKNNSQWQGKTVRQIVPYAVLRTLGSYFGNYWATENTVKANRSFYLERGSEDSGKIHLNELKGKGFAVCAEKAAVAQNLLTFLGYESELFVSTLCKLGTSEDELIGGHLYLVVKSGEEYLIFDPTNPIFVYKEDGSIQSALPCFYPIPLEEYQKLIEGGQVEVMHNDYFWDGQNTQKGPDKKRIYGGPSKVTLIE